MGDYRIDELAHEAGTTVRNVRAYQDRGLLPAPRREGRIGWYGDEHLARLRLVGGLLERGYTLANIGELLEAWQEGRDVAQLLGIETTLLSSWTDEHPQRMTAAELLELFGTGLDRSALDHALRSGLLVPVDGEDGEFEAPRPATLRAAAELLAAGVPISTVVEIGDRLRANVDDIARLFVTAVEEHVIGERGPARRGDDLVALSDLLARLRPLAHATVAAELGSAMERRISSRVSEHLARARDGCAGRAS